jgi:hypothetical protein
MNSDTTKEGLANKQIDLSDAGVSYVFSRLIFLSFFDGSCQLI